MPDGVMTPDVNMTAPGGVVRFDPNVPTGAWPNYQGAQSNTGANALGTLDTYTQLNQRLQAIKLFNASFAARQRMGQIIAGSPDLETGLANASMDPNVQAFAGEQLNTARQAMLALTQQAQVQQTMATSGLDAVVKSLPAALTDPSLLPGLVNSRMATLSPDARKRVGPAVNQLVESLTGGLPSDPAQARSVFNQRLAGMAVAGGWSSDGLQALLGKPDMVDTGGAKYPVVRLPPQLGGGVVPAGSPYIQGVAPSQSVQPLGAGGAPGYITSGGVPGGPVGGNALSARGGPTVAPTTNAGTSAGGVPVVPGATTPPPRGASGPVSAAVGGTTPLAQQAYGSDVGKAMAALDADMGTQLQQLPSAVRRIDMMTDSLENFQAGGGANMRATLAKGLQAAKNAGAGFISQKLIDDVGNTSLSDTQVFNAEVKPLVISELKAAAQGTGRVMRSEVDAFIQMMDSTTDPTALMQLLNQARYTLQVGVDQADKFAQYKQMVNRGDPVVKGYDLSPTSFFDWYYKHTDQGTLPTQAGPGLNLAPVAPSKAKGAKGSTAARPPLDSFFQ